MIRAIVVDDDFRVARVHAQIVSATAGFEVVAEVNSGSAALAAVMKRKPDLVLLDLYLPDVNGLEVLARIRALSDPPDVIVLTAANDTDSVHTASRRGAIHYLTKPFNPQALHNKLLRYAELHRQRSAEGELTQTEIDELFGAMRGAAPPPHTSRGSTGQLLLDALIEAGAPLSAAELAERIGVSRATAYRHLSLLVDAGTVRLGLRYGGAGRPEHRYEVVPRA